MNTLNKNLNVVFSVVATFGLLASPNFLAATKHINPDPLITAQHRAPSVATTDGNGCGGGSPKNHDGTECGTGPKLPQQIADNGDLCGSGPKTPSNNEECGTGP
ncbi:MAG: hypothetical protein ACPGQS_01075, partial [Bradymonadia bacterium]